MNWDLLLNSYPHVFERIIRHVASSDILVPNSEYLDAIRWLFCVQTYGQVSRQWREVILSSTGLFGPGKESTIVWHSNWESGSYGVRKCPQSLINEGYLRVVETLQLHDLTTEENKLVISHAVDNKVKELSTSLVLTVLRSLLLVARARPSSRLTSPRFSARVGARRAPWG